MRTHSHRQKIQEVLKASELSSLNFNLFRAERSLFQCNSPISLRPWHWSTCLVSVATFCLRDFGRSLQELLFKIALVSRAFEQVS